MTAEMAREANVAEGSSLVIYLSQDGVSVEVLPPVTDEIRNSVAAMAAK